MARQRRKPGRETEAELLSRIQHHISEWHEVQRSVGPVDRPAAERAFRRLYRLANRAQPRVLWVASPAAGAQAYRLARVGHQPILGTWTKGDIGNGEHRAFNALADPFDLPPSWLYSFRRRIARRLPGGLSAETVTEELSRGQWLTMAALRREIQRRGVSDPQPRRPLPRLSPARAEALARAAVGRRWDQYLAVVDARLASKILQRAVDSAVSSFATLSTTIDDILQAMQPGQFDAAAPLLALMVEVLQPPRSRAFEHRAAILEARIKVARSAGVWWALDGLVIASERPTSLGTDQAGRLHDEAGPALIYPDGFELWAWHGVVVPKVVVLEPERITGRTIASQANVEVRRVMMERVGFERLTKEGSTRLVHEDAAGRLWATNWGVERGRWGDAAAACFVEVENSTPEPDGSRKHYFIRVPPGMATAKQAVAWTFQLGPLAYVPEIQT